MFRVSRRPWWVALEYDPQVLWVGVFLCWKPAHYWTQDGLVTTELHIVLCVVPCLPVHVVLGRVARKAALRPPCLDADELARPQQAQHEPRDA